MFSAFRLIAAAVVALAIAVGAWRLLPLSSSVGSPAPSPSATPVALPSATFGRVVPSNGAGAPAGAWTLSFSVGQLWLHGPNGERIQNQVAGSTATDVSLDRDLNPDICSFGNAQGSYTWALSGSTLTLAAVSDPSACRSTILSGAWTATP